MYTVLSGGFHPRWYENDHPASFSLLIKFLFVILSVFVCHSESFCLSF